jgi:uncharacterized protein (DUF58 family)
VTEALHAIRKALDWGKLTTLRLRAFALAEEVRAGAHRSRRRGAGVEFGGHRVYVPGDDLRFLDRRAMMRHDRLLVREFETETNRRLTFLVDASRSMAYASEGARTSKFSFGAVVVAALTRVALSGSDTVSLDWLGGSRCRPLPATGGPEAFDRIVDLLEGAGTEGDLEVDDRALDRALGLVGRRARRGSIVVVVSDFLDLPAGAHDRIASLGAGGRTVVAVSILDPAEAAFPFQGPIRFRSSEGNHFVETDASGARGAYLDALARNRGTYRESLVARGGRFVEATTSDDPVSVVRSVLEAIEGAPA